MPFRLRKTRAPGGGAAIDSDDIKEDDTHVKRGYCRFVLKTLKRGGAELDGLPLRRESSLAVLETRMNQGLESHPWQNRARENRILSRAL